MSLSPPLYTTPRDIEVVSRYLVGSLLPKQGRPCLARVACFFIPSQATKPSVSLSLTKVELLFSLLLCSSKTSALPVLCSVCYAYSPTLSPNPGTEPPAFRIVKACLCSGVPPYGIPGTLPSKTEYRSCIVPPEFPNSLLAAQYPIS